MVSTRETVQNMKVYDPPTESRRGKLRLDFNENTVGCSPKVLEALRNITPEDVCVYPEYPKFKEKLANYLGIDASQVLPTNGTDEAIKIIMDTYLDKDDEIILPIPTFAMFEVYADIVGAKKVTVLYNPDLSFPTDAVLKKINNKTKMVILVNPNNPTGTAVKEDDIVAIVEKARNAIVLIDEAYYQYFQKSSKDLVNKYSNVIVIQTFSKAFGLAGLRIGYIISNKDVISNLKKVISPYSVNSIAVLAASKALDDLEFVNNYVEEVLESRAYVEAELKRLGVKIFQTKANFMIANFGDKCNFVYEKLNEKNILVRDRSKDPLLGGCLRIGIGTMEQNRKLIEGVKDILREKAVLFDIDGVLVDVSKSYRQAIQKTAEFFTQKEVRPEEIQEFKEKGGYNNDWDLTEAIILKRNVKIPKDKIIQKFQEFYLGSKEKKGFIDNEIWLLDKGTLSELYKKYRLGIITGRPREEACYALNKAAVIEFFDVIVAMEDCPKEKAKPDPFGINLALKKMGGKDAIYLGDSIDDIKAAVNAGITGVGVMPPNISSDRSRQLLKNNGAETVLDSINQINAVLR